MNNKYITTICCILAALMTPVISAQTEIAPASDKPIIAVPMFTNKTGGQLTSMGAGTSLTDGEWKLPDVAGEIAADAATTAIVTTRRFRILSRSEPALKTAEQELAYQSTGSVEASQLLSTLKSMNAKYLMLGRINRFRVDETTARAYGIQRRQVITSVSLDLQLIDVQTMEIIAGEPMQEKIVMRIPEGVNTTSIYDWEPIMRKAISSCVPRFLSKLETSSAATDELEHSAAMVDLEITSTPEGADVEFNNTFMGNTPCTISVPATSGTLSISVDGYSPWVKRIKPTPGMRIAPKLKEIKQPTPVVAPQQPEVKE